MKTLHLDIETYSTLDLKKGPGTHEYASCPDFEIIMVQFALDDEPVEKYKWKDAPQKLFDYFDDPDVIIKAWNAAFERICLLAAGIYIPMHRWRCVMVAASYGGLPMSLDQASKVLNLGDHGKLSGTVLINYFCKPCKPTKTNGGRTRNLPEHNPEKWEEFERYGVNDVEAERLIDHYCESLGVPSFIWPEYWLDQEINDRGVRIDKNLAANAAEIDKIYKAELLEELKGITGIDKPDAPERMKKWLREKTEMSITSLDKEHVENLLMHDLDPEVSAAIRLYQRLGKRSTSKYVAMLQRTLTNDYGRGMFQFLGARTGRWAGRGVQLQNLPKNKMKDLETARNLVAKKDYEKFSFFYNVPYALSELIRTAFIPSPGTKFAASDFKSIEAMVLAWMANEGWRISVFNNDGKIYEASAARMFNVPIEAVTKESEERAKGKVAELALGYQGSVGALRKMGGESMGLSVDQMELIVDKWRAANPKIVQLWKDINRLAIRAVRDQIVTKHSITGIKFKGTPQALRVKLPSGRELIYHKAHLVKGEKGWDSIRYFGIDSSDNRKVWGPIYMYGGKFVENLCQAISRDIMMFAMFEVDALGYPIRIHVHDEIVVEVPEENAEEHLRIIEHAMSKKKPEWARDIPLNTDGHLCSYYHKND